MNKSLLQASVSVVPLFFYFSTAAQTQPITSSISATAEPTSTEQSHLTSNPSKADGDGVADIVVTAQRRSQSLQKTALSIQVIQPATLATAGVTRAVDLTKLLPGVQIGSSGPSPTVYIRGVGDYSATAINTPAVPFYIDGVYVARSQSVPSEFYDVERVEVLKGPQGTLYGRNASGGAVNILSRKPDFSALEGRAEAEIGNFGNQTLEAAVNVPVTGNMAIRASGQIADKGGFSSAGLGDDVHQSARIKLRWAPTSDVDAIFSASYGHVGGRGQTSVLLNKNVPGWYPWLDSTGPQGRAFIAATGIPGLVVAPSSADAFQDLKFWNISAELNWNLNGATLTVLPAYRRAEMAYRVGFTFDYDNGGAIGALPPHPETSNESSVEVRLANDTERLKWVVGGYFFNEDQYQQYHTTSGLIQNVGVVTKLGTLSFAGFGQATVKLLDHVRLIVGARYTSDRRSLDGASYLINPSVLGTPAFPAGCIGPAAPSSCLADSYTGRKTFENFSWKGGFEADVLIDSLLYATASRGFKAGGFNTQSGVTPGQASPFSPERLTSYDVGLKNRFLDGKLQLNLSGFYWDYQDHQEPKVNGTAAGSVNLIFYNAGKARIYGATADIIARPWRGGTFNASAEYANSRYSSFRYTSPAAFVKSSCPQTPTGTLSAFGPVSLIDCSGFEVARTPKWSGSVGFTQDVPLGEGTLSANATTTFASARWLAIEFTPIERAKAYALVDLSLTFRSSKNRWFVTGFIRNANNGRSYTFATQSPYSDAYVSTIGSPRTYGGRVGFSF